MKENWRTTEEEKNLRSNAKKPSKLNQTELSLESPNPGFEPRGEAQKQVFSLSIPRIDRRRALQTLRGVRYNPIHSICSTLLDVFVAT